MNSQSGYKSSSRVDCVTSVYYDYDTCTIILRHYSEQCVWRVCVCVWPQQNVLLLQVQSQRYSAPQENLRPYLFALFIPCSESDVISSLPRHLLYCSYKQRLYVKWKDTNLASANRPRISICQR